MKIKKPNKLDSSLVKFNDYKTPSDVLLKEHPFLIFKEKLEESWKAKNKEINSSEENEKIFNKIKNLSMTSDSLKNKSLISYIDAPWGSGKTYFIENLIKWIKFNNEDKKEISFFFGWDKEKKVKTTKEMDISVIDAWEIYNGNNIEDFLIEIFSQTEEDILKIIKKIAESENFEISSSFLQIKRFGFITKSALKIFPVSKGPTQAIEELLEKFPESEKTKFKNKTKDFFKQKKSNDLLTILIKKSIEEKYSDNNKLIIIDNIERLSSKNRLDVINKILNWANISGTTFLFLTYFEKINFASLNEEDFWNKISLYETFNLINDWENYVNNYTYEEIFELKNYKNLSKFINKSISIFFSENNDAFDIREIKKLLDNWINSLNYDKLLQKTPIEEEREKIMIVLFFNMIQNQIFGLDKYFFINQSITFLSENEEFWKYWKKDLSNLNVEEIEKEFNPLINNKMFRIQSNFFDLKISFKKDSDDKIINFVGKTFEVRKNEIEDFKKFNNFIDKFSSDSYIEIINMVFKTRELNIELNKDAKILFDYIESNSEGTKKINYFEFKYNNIKKLHIYNQIKKS